MGKVRRHVVSHCLVSGCPNRVCGRGLCGTHLSQHHKQGKHNSLVATNELLHAHFSGRVGYWVFEKHLTSITKGLPVSRETKGRFKRAMLNAYKESEEE